MSRCFPYPPPGYSGEQGSGQALIESIKLQRERELAKAEAKKDKKREKKERRKHKKDHKKDGLERRKHKKDHKKDGLEKRKHKKDHKKDGLKTCLIPAKKIHKESSTVLKSASLLNLLQSENEQLERSSLTEEHAKPTGEQKPSTSSDSTQNTSKRKREDSSPAVVRQEENSIRSNGNVIRIRLSSQKPNALVGRQDPSSTTSERKELPFQKQSSIISSQEPCSVSGRADLSASGKLGGGQVDLSSIQSGKNNVVRVCPPKLVGRVDYAAVRQSAANELPKGSLRPSHDREVCTTFGGLKPITIQDDIAARDPKSVDKKSITLDDDIAVRNPKSLNKKLVKAELRYRDLFVNWAPPPPQMKLESDDQDWLLGKKNNPDNQNEKKLKPSYNGVCGSSTWLWPHAQFIGEADMYALPFTVPF